MAEDDKPTVDRTSKMGRKAGGGNRRNKTTPDALATQELRGQVMTLRKRGLNFSGIGAALGFTRQRAYTILSEALNEIITEPAREVVALELQRLDTLLAAVFEAAERGDKAAIDSALRIMAQRAKLLGLDKPMPVVSSEQPLQIHIVAVPAKPEFKSASPAVLTAPPLRN